MSDSPQGNAAPNDDDLESARAQLRADRAELEAARLRHEMRSRQNGFSLLQRTLDGLRIALWIVAAWVPLNAIQPIARSFAGTDTRFEAGLTISMTLTVLMTVALSVTFAQSRLRKQKVQRLRKRQDELEALVLHHRRRIDRLESKLREEE